LPGFSARELAMDMRLEEKAIEGCQPGEYREWIEFYTRREEQWLQVLRTLMLEEPCQLTAVLFDGMDKLQHLLYRFLDPAYVEKGADSEGSGVRQLALSYYRRMDRILSEIVELAGPGATIVLASDHGFGPQASTFFVNAWLQQRGYLAWADGQGPSASDTESLGIGQLARHVSLLDWERTKAYAPTPSGNGIHIVVAGRGSEHGVPATEYERFRNQLVQELREFRAPASGERVVSQVWLREDVFAGPTMALAPDVTVQLADGGQVSILASDEPVKLRSEVRGAHRMEGILVANGPQLRAGETLGPLSILDVAPLLLHSLDLPIPEDMEGSVPVGALKPEALQANPVRKEGLSREAAMPSDSWAGPAMDEEDEAEMLRRLRALGYVE
jgi:predicted AlkP superfamily phosphohydrolase/phosphomutase